MSQSFYPKYYYVPIEGNADYLGEIIIQLNQKNYNAEINILFSESRKIFSHVGFIYNKEDERDCLALAYHKLGQFLNQATST